MKAFSRFSDVGGDVLAAVQAGATIADAARAVGVAEATVRGWLSQGRRDPGSQYAAFAGAIDAARLARPDLPPAGGLSEADVVQLLELAASKGSVPAAKALLDRLERNRGAAPSGSDEFDELKARRGRVG